MKNRNIVEEITSHSEKPAEEMVENKDQTEGLKEEDKILKFSWICMRMFPLETLVPALQVRTKRRGVLGQLSKVWGT